MKENVFREKTEEYSTIIIYGAGMVGSLVYDRMCAFGLASRVTCFAVSGTAGISRKNGVEVRCISDLILSRDDALVIVAVVPDSQEEIKKKLEELEFKNVLPVDGELFDELSHGYIEDFNKRNPVDTLGSFSVLMMASDNNRTSGAFLCMAELCRKLRDDSFSVLVVLPCYGTGEELLDEMGIRYIYVESEDWCIDREGDTAEKLRLMKKNDSAVETVSQVIRECGIRCVHNNTAYTFVGTEAAQRVGLPVVWHLRENITVQGKCFVNEQKTRTLINSADLIVCVSDYIVNSYSWLDGGKVRVISDGVDADRFYKKRHIFVGDECTIVCIGAIAEFKGQIDLVRALVYLKETGDMLPKVLFVGNGESDYISRLKKTADDGGVSGKIEFFGRRNDIEVFYEKADILVSCSDGESFGRIVAEGMLSGCLCIGSNTGATAEIIDSGKNGYLYKRGDHEDLGRLIRKAMKNPDNSLKLALCGQKEALERYTININAKRMEEIYASLCS